MIVDREWMRRNPLDCVVKHREWGHISDYDWEWYVGEWNRVNVLSYVNWNGTLSSGDTLARRKD